MPPAPRRFDRSSTTDQVLDGIDLGGRTALVPGASSGLGAESARALAAHGAKVVMSGRDVAKTERVAEKIRLSTGNASVEVMELHLERPASVRAFAKSFLARHRVLHHLIGNAGIMACPLQRTAEGWEMQFCSMLSNWAPHRESGSIRRFCRSGFSDFCSTSEVRPNEAPSIFAKAVCVQQAVQLDLFDNDTSPIVGPLATFLTIRLKLASHTDQEPVWDQLVRQQHYLGCRKLLGRRLKYLAFSQDRPVAALSWSAPALKTRARDEYIGWSQPQRKAHLHRIVNNSRFLILPWVRIPHLASHVLGLNIRRLKQDWRTHFGTDVYPTIFYRAHRFQVKESGEFWLSETPTAHRSLNWGSAFPRMVTYGLFQEAGRGEGFYFINTHLDHISQEARLKGAGMIRDFFFLFPEPIFLAGDFNEPPDSPVYQQFLGSGRLLYDT